MAVLTALILINVVLAARGWASVSRLNMAQPVVHQATPEMRRLAQRIAGQRLVLRRAASVLRWFRTRPEFLYAGGRATHPAAWRVVYRNRARATVAGTRIRLWEDRLGHLNDYVVPAFPWYALATCEQWSPNGVRWDAWNSTYEGAYGFTHAAWRQWRLPWMPRYANQATPRVQTLVAQRIQADVGWGAWPACHIRLGLH